MREFSWMKDPKAGAISVFAMAVLAGIGLRQPLAAGACAVLLPLLGVAMWPVAGLLTAFLGAALPQVCLALQGASMALHLYCGGYALLLAGVSLWAFGRKPRFFKALFAHWGALAAGVCLLIMALRTVVGANIFTGCAQWAVDLISQSPACDQVLYKAYQGGLASAPGSMITMPPVNSYLRGFGLESMMPLMTPALRHELAASLRTTLERSLYADVPGAVTTFIIVGGLMAVCWPVCRLKRRGQEPQLAMPAFETWHLPRGMGRWSILLAAGLGIQLFATQYWELYWGAMLATAFQWLYMIQGAAYWEFAQKRMGGSAISRRAFILFIGVFIPYLLVAFGVLDQRLDKRGLREKTDT